MSTLSRKLLLIRQKEPHCPQFPPLVMKLNVLIWEFHLGSMNLVKIETLRMLWKKLIPCSKKSPFIGDILFFRLPFGKTINFILYISVTEGRYGSPQSASSVRSVTGNGSSAPSSGRNITLNIWDFAGQAAYYTTHQVSRPNVDHTGQLLPCQTAHLPKLGHETRASCS